MGRSLFYSLVLHLTIGLFAFVDLPDFMRKPVVVEEAPIIVDLSEVTIGGITNLPEAVGNPEEEKGLEDISTGEEEPEDETAEEAEPEPKYTQAVASAFEEVFSEEDFDPVEMETEEIEDVPEIDFKDFEQPEPDPDAVQMVQDTPEKKLEEKKPEEKKKEPVKKKIASVKPPPIPSRRPALPKITGKVQKHQAGSLESLLASVDGMKKGLKKKKTVNTGNNKDGVRRVSGGIAGGTGGTLGRGLTISEKDAIASRIRQCWNFDPGARGIEKMLIEIRVHLKPDGSVRDVQIIDLNNYQSDTFFKSVADSARRAVYICSPYELPDGKYDIWKTILLRFNPMDGGVS